jgi:hypothetical protein
MDIPALSIAMNQSQLAQNVSIALMEKVMNVSTSDTQALIKMMELNVNPNVGSNLDLKV